MLLAMDTVYGHNREVRTKGYNDPRGRVYKCVQREKIMSRNECMVKMCGRMREIIQTQKTKGPDNTNGDQPR